VKVKRIQGPCEGEDVEMEKRFQGPEKVKKEGLGVEKGVREWRWRYGGTEGGDLCEGKKWVKTTFDG
jgi:hypothetical protein